MDNRKKKCSPEKRNEKINQFIIECIFSKYFEEQGSKIPAEKEEVASSA